MDLGSGTGSGADSGFAFSPCNGWFASGSRPPPSTPSSCSPRSGGELTCSPPPPPNDAATTMRNSSPNTARHPTRRVRPLRRPLRCCSRSLRRGWRRGGTPGLLLGWGRDRDICFRRGDVRRLMDRSSAVWAEAVLGAQFVSAVTAIPIRHRCDISVCILGVSRALLPHAP